MSPLSLGSYRFTLCPGVPLKKDVDVLVIGGGVIGVCVAYFLLKAGRSVTLLDWPRDSILAALVIGAKS